MAARVRRSNSLKASIEGETGPAGLRPVSIGVDTSLWASAGRYSGRISTIRAMVALPNKASTGSRSATIRSTEKPIAGPISTWSAMRRVRGITEKRTGPPIATSAPVRARMRWASSRSASPDARTKRGASIATATMTAAKSPIPSHRPLRRFDSIPYSSSAGAADHRPSSRTVDLTLPSSFAMSARTKAKSKTASFARSCQGPLDPGQDIVAPNIDLAVLRRVHANSMPVSKRIQSPNRALISKRPLPKRWRWSVRSRGDWTPWSFHPFNPKPIAHCNRLQPHVGFGDGTGKMVTLLQCETSYQIAHSPRILGHGSCPKPVAST